ncbi:MAG: hypothetical protein KGO49_07440 [Gammaproteobacteria bacterium]|nr:hypothetical protein [Gammaproteobacteria bacterium]
MAASLVVIAGVGYAGEQIYLSGQKRYQDIEDKQTALAQQISDINDRMVASARDEKTAPRDGSSDVVAGLTLSMTQVFPRHWLRQNLQLAQAQIEQDQTQTVSQTNSFQSAKDTLNLVKNNLNSLVTSQAISALTASALTRAIDADLQMIDHEAQTQRQEVQLLDRQIAQLQLTLDQMAMRGPSMHVTAASNSTTNSSQTSVSPSFMQRIRQLVIIERPAQDVRTDMLQRALICREVALTLGLARQALAQGQWDQVTQLLVDSRAQMAGLVDADARKMQTTLAGVSIKPHSKLQLTAIRWLPSDTVAPFKPTVKTDTVPALPQPPVAPRVVAS